MVDYLNSCDYILYQCIVDFLVPEVLRPIPGTLTQAIRNFAKSLELWLTNSLQGYSGNLVKAKVCTHIYIHVFIHSLIHSFIHPLLEKILHIKCTSLFFQFIDFVSMHMHAHACTDLFHGGLLPDPASLHVPEPLGSSRSCSTAESITDQPDAQRPQQSRLCQCPGQ